MRGVVLVVLLLIAAALGYVSMLEDSEPGELRRRSDGPVPAAHGDAGGEVVPAEIERVVSTPPEEAGGLPQQSGSAPPQSFEKRVEAVMLQERKSTLSKSQMFDSLDRVADIVRNRHFNPEGKVLTAEQEARLRELIDQYNGLWEGAGEVFGELHLEASLQALKAGQYEALEMGFSGSENQKRIEEAKEALSMKLGKELRDWRCKRVFRSSSDGDSWVALVWYTVAQHADAFEAADSLMGIRKEREGAYRRFFASLQ